MNSLSHIRLFAPGARRNNRTYVARLRVNGRETEISTAATTEEDAWLYLEMFDARLAAETEAHQRRVPKRMQLGHFEEWLLREFRLVGEAVVRKATGRVLRFHKGPGGYMTARVEYEHWKKNVYEHRMKFLLAYGWLPASVDHHNRNRQDNALANLRAATPAQQTANRRIARGSLVKNLQVVENP